MNKAISILALIFALSLCVAAKPNRSATSRTQQVQITTKRNIAQTQAGENSTPRNSAEAPAKPAAALLVPIVDSSPSVRPYWKKMQQAAKNIIEAAPDQASVAIVGIDAEAVKSEVFEPPRKADAMKFVDSLTIGGRFTDLARGTDAALSVVQSANPARCVLVYLTDGKLTVPKTFRDKSNFYYLLRREFTARTNVTVLIVNVGGDDSAAHESLPANVKIFSLKSASELPGIIEQTLSPTINEKLTAPPTLPSTTRTETPSTGNRIYMIGVAAVGAFIIVIISLVAWRRSRRSQMSELAEDAPGNLLRAEDLAPRQAISEPAVLLTAERVDERSGRRSFARRSLVRVGERVTIGSSSFVEMPLEGLKQSQALQVGFDGETARVFRLQPQSIGELDKIWLNQQPAPIQFELTERDLLTVGGFAIRVTVTTEDAVPSSLVSRSETRSSKTNLTSRRLADQPQGRSHYDRASL